MKRISAMGFRTLAIGLLSASAAPASAQVGACNQQTSETAEILTCDMHQGAGAIIKPHKMAVAVPVKPLGSAG